MVANKLSSSLSGRPRYSPPPARLPEEQATLIQACAKIKGVMNHTYRDYSKIPPEATYVAPRSIDDMTFSEKVHDILSNPDFEQNISWMPHGRAFKVHRPAEFERDICPVYFGHGRYSSWLRALNNYGFKHISAGIDRNCYYHELVLRGRPHLTQFMPRCRDARRLTADIEHEPNFYTMNQVIGAPDATETPPPPQYRAATPASSSMSSTTLLPPTNTSATTPPSASTANSTTETTTATLLLTLLAQSIAPALTAAPKRPRTPPPPPPSPPVVQRDELLVTRLVIAALLSQQLSHAE